MKVNGDIVNSNNLHVAPRMKNLYKFFKFNNKVIDIFGFDKALLDIYSQRVLEMIKNNEEGWEKMVPTYVDVIIKEHGLFGFKSRVNESIE